MEPEIRRLAEGVSERLVGQAAQATLLTGSHARGQARPYSDVDLFAVGDGPSAWMEVVDGRLVAVYWWTPEETRRRMLSPEEALLAVRAWRDGVLIDDPTGSAKSSSEKHASGRGTRSSAKPTPGSASSSSPRPSISPS